MSNLIQSQRFSHFEAMQCTLTVALATVIKCHSRALIVNGTVPYFALQQNGNYFQKSFHAFINV